LWLNVHVASKKLDLEGHDGLGDPDHGEDAAEDERALVIASVDREKEGQKQAEEQWSPRKIVSIVLLNIFAGHSTPAVFRTYQRSQSLNPSLIPPCSTASASGHLPTIPLNCPILGTPPARLSPSPRSAPPIPPPWFSMPPSKYFGHSTWRIFSQTASRSRRSVSHTVSSRVLTGARRSSPGMAELR
jgi:hypothetical protein